MKPLQPREDPGSSEPSICVLLALITWSKYGEGLAATNNAVPGLATHHLIPPPSADAIDTQAGNLRTWPQTCSSANIHHETDKLHTCTMGHNETPADAFLCLFTSHRESQCRGKSDAVLGLLRTSELEQIRRTNPSLVSS